MALFNFGSGGGLLNGLYPGMEETLPGMMGWPGVDAGQPKLNGMRGVQRGGIGIDPSQFDYFPPAAMYSEPNGDPNAGRYGALSGPQAMPQQSFIFSTEGKPKEPEKTAFDFRPGSPLDQLKQWYMAGGSMALPSGSVQAAPAAQPTMEFAGVPPMPTQQAQPPSWVGDMPRAGMSPQRATPLSLAPPNPTENDALPPNATLTQGGQVPGVNVQPQQAPQAPPFPGGGDRLTAGLGGLFNSQSLVSGIGNMIGGFATGQRQDARGIAQQNQTQTAKAIYDGLVANGTSPQQAYGIAVAAAGNPEIAKAILPQALGPKEPPKTMEEVYARQAYEAGRRGQGNGPSAPPSYQEWLTQKNAAEAKGKQIGETQGKASANLPVSQQRGQDVLTQIDELLAHPGFDRVFGLVGAFPNIPGGNAAGAQARLNQVKGQAFLDAYEMLKGGGAITEVEGAKATAAKARLDAAQSPDEARVALQDFKSAVRSGMQKLKEISGEAPVTAPINNGGWTSVTPGVRIREKQ